MNRTRSFVFVFIALTAVASFTGCKSSTSVDTQRTYKIGMVHWAGFSPLNVADANGFWNDEGVKVEVVNYVQNTDLNTNLENKGIDIALDMIGSWVDLRLQGKPITVIGETDWSNGGDKLIQKIGSNLDSLKGGKIGVYLNLLSVKNFVSKYLATKGFKLSDFTIEEVSDPNVLAQRFIDGTYQIIADYDPAATDAVTKGHGEVVATSADFPGCIPEGFAARNDVLEGIPHADLVAIFRGWADAVQWSQNPANWEAYKQIMHDRTFAGDNITNDAEYRTMLSNVKIHNRAAQYDVNKGGGELYKFLLELNTFAQANGFAGKSFAPSDVFDNGAILEALQ